MLLDEKVKNEADARDLILDKITKVSPIPEGSLGLKLKELHQQDMETIILRSWWDL